MTHTEHTTDSANPTDFPAETDSEPSGRASEKSNGGERRRTDEESGAEYGVDPRTSEQQHPLADPLVDEERPGNQQDGNQDRS
ncbi:hypothetical protein [Mycetocola saprophilus]|uniref:hypothetical protein n=1 Tax=Mycetocola saprophilus TaxID=76636 RepID=UPI003BF0BFB6